MAVFFPKEIPNYFYCLQKRFRGSLYYSTLKTKFFSVKLVKGYGIYSGSSLLDDFSREIENCWQLLNIASGDWRLLYTVISTQTSSTISTPAPVIFRFIYTTEVLINYIASSCDHLAKYFFLVLFDRMDGFMAHEHQDAKLEHIREYYHNFVEYLVKRQNKTNDLSGFVDILKKWQAKLGLLKDVRNFEQHTGRITPIYWIENKKLKMDFTCLRVEPPFNELELIAFDELVSILESYNKLMCDTRLWYEEYLSALGL